MRKFLLALFVIGLAANVAGAQAEYAGRQRTLSLSAGGIISGFEPGYTTQDGTNYLFGGGALVNFRLTHWVQLEGEGRWQRLNLYTGHGEKMDQLLIGPRVPIKRLFSRYDTYGKGLFGRTNAITPDTEGNFFTIAVGGTVERKIKKRFIWRVVDFEYDVFDKSTRNNENGTHTDISLHPYGISMGVSYKIF